MAFAKLPPQPGTHHGRRRSADRFEIPNTSAASATLKPPKNRNSTSCDCRGSNLPTSTKPRPRPGHRCRAPGQAQGRPPAARGCGGRRVWQPHAAAHGRQHAGDRLGRQGKEVRTPLPIDGRSIHEFQVSLVHQGRRLKRNAFRFLPEKPSGQVPRALDKRLQQAIDRRPIPLRGDAGDR